MAFLESRRPHMFQVQGYKDVNLSLQKTKPRIPEPQKRSWEMASSEFTLHYSATCAFRGHRNLGPESKGAWLVLLMTEYLCMVHIMLVLLTHVMPELWNEGGFYVVIKEKSQSQGMGSLRDSA